MSSEEKAKYQIHYFKRSGKWYCTDDLVSWPPDPGHYSGFVTLSSLHRIPEMFAVALESPMGFPQFSRPLVAATSDDPDPLPAVSEESIYQATLGPIYQLGLKLDNVFQFIESYLRLPVKALSEEAQQIINKHHDEIGKQLEELRSVVRGVVRHEIPPTPQPQLNALHHLKAAALALASAAQNGSPEDDERHSMAEECALWSAAIEYGKTMGIMPKGAPKVSASANVVRTECSGQEEEEWADRKTPEDEDIKAAFPTKSGRHDLYMEAMRLVGDRHSKHALVALVNWLLHRSEKPFDHRAVGAGGGDDEGYTHPDVLKRSEELGRKSCVHATSNRATYHLSDSGWGLEWCAECGAIRAGDMNDKSLEKHKWTLPVLISPVPISATSTVPDSSKQRWAAVSLIVRPNEVRPNEVAAKEILCVWNKRYNGWTLPGGMVEDGETREEAQERELLEETGLKTQHSTLIFEGEHGLKLQASSGARSGRASMVAVYRVQPDIFSPTTTEEGCPVAWLTTQEFIQKSPFGEFYARVFAALGEENRSTSAQGCKEHIQALLEVREAFEVVQRIRSAMDHHFLHREKLGNVIMEILDSTDIAAIGGRRSPTRSLRLDEAIAAAVQVMQGNGQSGTITRIDDKLEAHLTLHFTPEPWYSTPRTSG